MEEGILSDSLPDFKELENKIGRKTPESLLIWMRDAALLEDCWSSDVVDRIDHHNSISDSFSDKIRHLKLEMSRLRSADVSILRQLVAVHEGIEAMRWLMEEQGTLASRGSSLTGSLTSLVALEGGPGPSMSPCRESPSSMSLQDPYDTAENEEPSDPMLNNDDVLCRTHNFYQWNSESSKEGPPNHSNSKSGLSCTSEERRSQAWSSPNSATANTLVSGANHLELQPQVSHIAQTQDFKTGAEYRIHIADPVRRALVRSSKIARRGLTGGIRSAPSLKTEEDTPIHCGLPRESPRACENNVAVAEQSMPSREEVLLGYDAQWHWVESEDDVTFL